MERGRKGTHDEEAFILASGNGDLEIVKCLLAVEGVCVNARNKGGWTALIKASGNGHLEIVKCLLAVERIDVNAKDHKYGWTALIEASKYGYLEIVKLLLAVEGIDVNATDNDGSNVLIHASLCGRLKIAKCLMQHFVTVDIDELSQFYTFCARDICLNWKRYLPRWSHRNHIFFPSDLRKTVVMCCWVFGKIQTKQRIPKDIKRLLITHIVEDWKLTDS